MNINSLVDFTHKVNEDIGKFQIQFILSPEQLSIDHYVISTLQWDSISYGDAELNKVPDDKRGVYAFAISKQGNKVQPQHCYVLYIGIAGKDSNRSLRERYRDYLNEKKVIKRERIARMIGTWHSVLRFFFAPVNDSVSSSDLQLLEKQLNSSLMPPFSIGDLEAGIKSKRRAFQ
ncbi:MAG: hypothetical protein AB7N91_14690 [Candidatus Tectimicrobiota bacterium]